MTTTASTDYGHLLKETFHRFFRTENVVPLLLGFVVMMLLGLVTLGITLPALAVGYSRILLAVARGEPARFDDLWRGFDRFGTALVAGVLFALAVAIGSIVIVGGVIAAFFFTFVFMLIAERPSLGAVDALTESASLVKANLADVLVAWVLSLVLTSVLSPTIIGSVLGGAFAALFTALVYVRITELPAPDATHAHAY
ncbi:hypothetical protein L6R52_43220 [Myxococcota bacterium]|nr:hypothetical protein [Myxococcota bacterium]